MHIGAYHESRLCPNLNSTLLLRGATAARCIMMKWRTCCLFFSLVDQQAHMLC
jgi:hypothetical protein